MSRLVLIKTSLIFKDCVYIMYVLNKKARCIDCKTIIRNMANSKRIKKYIEGLVALS